MDASIHNNVHTLIMIVHRPNEASAYIIRSTSLGDSFLICKSVSLIITVKSKYCKKSCM
jgi:hypothetical protein